MWTKVKTFFSKLWGTLRDFLSNVFTATTSVVVSELKGIAINTVKELSSTDLSDDKKREQAFDAIYNYAIDEGLNVKDSVINLVIEMAVQYVKNLGDE